MVFLKSLVNFRTLVVSLAANTLRSNFVSYQADVSVYNAAKQICQISQSKLKQLFGIIRCRISSK